VVATQSFLFFQFIGWEIPCLRNFAHLYYNAVQHRLAETMYEQSYLLQSDYWKYFISQYIFILCVQISIKMGQSMYYSTYPPIRLRRQLLRVLHEFPAFSEDYQTRICSYVY